MWGVKCPYCSGTSGRCTTTPSGRSITECCSCGRVVEERQTQPHDLFLVRAQDNPLCVVTSDLASIPSPSLTGPTSSSEDPFEPTGFITSFSTWSLEPHPIFARSSISFSGQLAELERSLDFTSASGPAVVVDNLRAYLQIIDVASLLGLDYDISDHAFQLFRDCSSATCLRNRSVEALATAALVQAIREAQEPRTLQEISIAANLPQKEIGKYIKILGEALQLSQPINSNSISVHMPRFCTLLQLNKSAQELATHIGEVVINKCFCTRRNPISISAAAIYLACQLEDKRKTQAEICKVTGLTEVTLRKVYKELLENWGDLLPSNYTPAVPPEKAFPTTAFTAGRSSVPWLNTIDVFSSSGKDKQPEETKPKKLPEVSDVDNHARGKTEATEHKGITCLPFPSTPFGSENIALHGPKSEKSCWKPPNTVGMPGSRAIQEEKSPTMNRVININENQLSITDKKIDSDLKASTNCQKSTQFSSPSAENGSSNTGPTHAQHSTGSSLAKFVQQSSEITGAGVQNKSEKGDPSAKSGAMDF